MVFIHLFNFFRLNDQEGWSHNYLQSFNGRNKRFKGPKNPLLKQQQQQQQTNKQTKNK